MKYEYDFEKLEVSKEQEEMMGLGLGDVSQINVMIRELVNRRAKDGWEPMYPFSVPDIWFKKQLITRRKKKNDD